MILWLDHLIFGNGHGLASPYFDNTFYWLVDTYRGRRADCRGRLYRWWPGYGAQLASFEWRSPKPGTRRRLGGREYVVFSSRRRWCRVEVNWALVGLPEDASAARAMFKDVEVSLGKYDL